MSGPTAEGASAASGALRGELTFLAPPGEAADWRLVVLVDTAARAGLLDALPGSAGDLAGALGLEPSAVQVVLDALGAWELVELGADGRYHAGVGGPDRDLVLQIAHHARMLRRWATSLDDRLRGVAGAADPGATPEPAAFLDSLAVAARQSAPDVVERCLRRFPDAGRVLELGGGHGEYGLEFARRGRQVTMQDRPAVIELARQRGRLEEAGVVLFAGDLHETLPDGPFDLAFCAGVTHTFSGPRNADLYHRLRPRLAPGGGIAIVTLLRRHDAIARLFAVQMMANAHGGDTHGEDDYRAWLGDAGFGPVELDDGSGARSFLFADVH
ncbi:MAG TPA: class I SAM-dependent methyltransferase [Acidimicrobiales bacterium]|nr:class I SAM-dependent methyltransferase [Acidimicrobiales bacterium]